MHVHKARIFNLDLFIIIAITFSNSVLLNILHVYSKEVLQLQIVFVKCV